MVSLFRRTLLHNQLRQLQRCTVAFSVRNFNVTTEKTAFLDVLPEVKKCILTSPKLTKVPEVQNVINRIVDHTLLGGKLLRGLIVSNGYRMLEDPEHFSEETLHLARILGWCIELATAHFMIIDDIIDGSTSRRGKPCWYLQPNVGVTAVNDATLVYQSMLEVLETYFGNEPYYIDIIRHFQEAHLMASIGQFLDYSSCCNINKNNIDFFNMDRYNALALNKTAVLTVKMPIFVALLLVKNGKDKATKDLADVCLALGSIFQFQDDYLDVYGENAETGKVGTDIQEGKCSWIAVTALQHCNEVQRSIFMKYYGSKDPEHVKRIKQLYDELHLPELFKQHERTLYEDCIHRINKLPTEGERKLLLGLLNVCYKRRN